jgi:tRNA (cmo5U34)-methyltransferase
MPFSETGIKIALKRWGSFQMEHGKGRQEVEDHLKRFNTEYFPITISEHIALLREAGFDTAEILWGSYMQAGFYAVKPRTE